MTTPKKTYSIVENPGTDAERVTRRGLQYLQAACIRASYSDDDPPVDVMRELPDGSLTTEY